VVSDEQLPLFTEPAPRPGMRAAPAKPRYAQYRPKTRQLCDDCIAVIHALGPARAPLPRVVRWRRSTADDVLHLCDIHRNERQEIESA
jgi:hypothetical protein